jgi:hypothetical protein
MSRKLDQVYQDHHLNDDSDYEDALDGREDMISPTSLGGSSELSIGSSRSRDFNSDEINQKISSNVFLIIYLLLAVAALTIGIILEIDSKLLANSNYRNYLDTNKFVLYIFIGYQAALILIFSILLYVNNTAIDRYSFIDNDKLLAVSSAFFLINIILFTLEIFNGKGNFYYTRDYIMIFLSAGALLYFIYIIYGLIKNI